MNALVLIVEDHVDTAQLYAEYLTSLGYRAHTAGSTGAALQILSTVAFDAVVLDHGLPDADGLTLARQIRARTNQRQPVLIALTGRTPDEPDDDTALFDAYLVKPCLPDELAKVLSRTITDRGGSR